MPQDIPTLHIILSTPNLSFYHNTPNLPVYHKYMYPNALDEPIRQKKILDKSPRGIKRN